MFEPPNDWFWTDRGLSTATASASEEVASLFPPAEQDTQTIQSVVGNPVMFGAIFLLICMIFFSVAIHYEWNDELAPRAANRPKAVMKNAILHGFSDRYKDKIYIYPFAWIVWSYNLTYKQCLSGIPGTGTRKDGWEGPLLKTNLDAVILLKFHTLVFKIGLLVAALCLIVILPVNTTAGCDPAVFGSGTCAQHDKLSGFVRTTIANIPDKVVSSLFCCFWNQCNPCEGKDCVLGRVSLVGFSNLYILLIYSHSSTTTMKIRQSG